MRICITLDDVIRNKTYQFGKTYQKNIGNDIELETLDLSSGDLMKIFNFKSKKEYNKFLYEDYPFEIFSEANACTSMLDKKLLLWQLALEEDYDEDEDEKIDIWLSNTNEFNTSIGYTYFFLSKIATRIREVYFPKNSQEIWDKSDIVITADKKLLENKPEGKISIKIETDYNKDIKSDYTYNNLESFLNDKEIIKIIKNGRN